MPKTLFSLMMLFSLAHAQSALTKETTLFEYADESHCTIKNGEHETLAVVPLLVAEHSAEGAQPELIIKALEESLKNRQCDIHAPDAIGLNALQAAILFNDVTMVRYLLENGADPKRFIAHEQNPLNGKNSFEFLEILKTKESDDKVNRDEIERILQEYR